MSLENTFIGLRNHSFEEIIEWSKKHEISHKEKLILHFIYEDAANEINEFIKEVGASKNLNESDFDWSMKLYIFMCIQIFFDIFDNIEKLNDPHLKAFGDINKQDLIKKIKKIFGGDNIDVYVDDVYKFIEETNKETKTYEDFIMGRIHIIFEMFKQNKVDIKELTKEKILLIAEKNYQDTVMNFVKTCI